MPAGLPGDSAANNLLNPTLGAWVIMDPLSGPKGSPLDNDKDVTTGTARGGCSTGALQTGIGHTAARIVDATSAALAPYNIFTSGFNDNSVPGEKVTVYAAPPPNGVVTTDIVDSTFMYIGGGKCTKNVDGSAPVVPYVAGIAICGAGNGGSRDGGAGPAFTGFPMKMVTATGAVATGAAIEAGFINRTGAAMAAFQSAFGSDAAQLAVAS